MSLNARCMVLARSSAIWRAFRWSDVSTRLSHAVFFARWRTMDTTSDDVVDISGPSFGAMADVLVWAVGGRGKMGSVVGPIGVEACMSTLNARGGLRINHLMSWNNVGGFAHSRIHVYMLTGWVQEGLAVLGLQVPLCLLWPGREWPRCSHQDNVAPCCASFLDVSPTWSLWMSHECCPRDLMHRCTHTRCTTSQLVLLMDVVSVASLLDDTPSWWSSSTGTSSAPIFTSKAAPRCRVVVIMGSSEPFWHFLVRLGRRKVELDRRHPAFLLNRRS